MTGDRGSRARPALARLRVVLRVLEAHQATGFLIPAPRGGAVVCRGPGGEDYACGDCGRLLAIGMRSGTFARFVFACGCGAWNQLPSRA